MVKEAQNVKINWFKKHKSRITIVALVAIIILLLARPPQEAEPPITYNHPTERPTQHVQAAEPKFETITLNGTGVKPTDPFELSSGGYRVSLTHTGTGNFIVDLMDSSGNATESLANEIGNANLTRVIRVDKGKYLFAVDHADGPWTIKIEAL